MNEFDINKIITPTSADKAVVGKYYYCDDAISKLRSKVLSNRMPEKLVSICDVYDEAFPFIMKHDRHLFLYPYEEADVCELVTQREFSKWLAQGNGEWARRSNTMRVYMYTKYMDSDGDTCVSDEILVRAFGDSEWSLPTKKYLEEHTR